MTSVPWKKRRRALLLAVGVSLAASSAVAAFVAWRARQPFWLAGKDTRSLARLRFSPSGEWLVGEHEGGGVSVWSLRDRALVSSLTASEHPGDFEVEAPSGARTLAIQGGLIARALPPTRTTVERIQIWGSRELVAVAFGERACVLRAP